ncbi:MAG TPA: pantetheine-phosphate adenylyltransferase [Candidatus Methylacidiphilales bacterium]
MGTPRRAIYPGSFDPITNGHIDVLKRAQGLFDELIVAVAANPAKTEPLFSIEERCDQIRAVAARLEKPVRVATFTGLLVEFAKKEGACAIVRGLRAVSDFEYEFQLALMNRNLAPEIETIFLMPKESYSFLSSSLIKGVAALGGPIGNFVPPEVEKALVARVGERKG